MIRNTFIAGAFALTAAFAMPMVATAATTTPAGGAVIDGTAAINVGDVWTVDIFGHEVDGSGSFYLGVMAGTDLIAIETNTINPATGFAGAMAEWNTESDGSGTTLASISLPEIASSVNEMKTKFFGGETAYLIVSWDDITANSSDFDVRITAISAVPLPAGGLLLLTGIGGLALRRRKKS